MGMGMGIPAQYFLKSSRMYLVWRERKKKKYGNFTNLSHKIDIFGEGGEGGRRRRRWKKRVFFFFFFFV